jgi:hypothetical protein
MSDRQSTLLERDRMRRSHPSRVRLGDFPQVTRVSLNTASGPRRDRVRSTELKHSRGLELTGRVRSYQTPRPVKGKRL